MQQLKLDPILGLMKKGRGEWDSSGGWVWYAGNDGASGASLDVKRDQAESCPPKRARKI